MTNMNTTTARRSSFAVFALALLSFGLVGCGGAAWQVRRGAWSGELALHGSITEAQYSAEDAMIAHCGGRARLVYGAEAEHVAIADALTVPPREVTVDHGGRRLHYVCVSRAPMAFRGRDTATTQTASAHAGPGGL